MYRVLRVVVFQSTLPTRGSDFSALVFSTVASAISIHAPHEGERLCCIALTTYALSISIHAPHEGERLFYLLALRHYKRISIHAPHEGERRYCSTQCTAAATNFNPRSPRGGATCSGLIIHWLRDIFQSTLPTRGSDFGQPAMNLQTKGISIHAPHEGERRWTHQGRHPALAISIHAPHEGERRNDGNVQACKAGNFNPRSPRGGATKSRAIYIPKNYISIHAPHEGERRIHAGWWLALSQFQSTLPTRGSDIISAATSTHKTIFQSTLPTRGSDAAKA